MATSHAPVRDASLHRRALLEAAQRDDRRAEEELLRRYEPLVRALVARVRLPYGCDRDDLAQDARLGLLGAIRAWQPDRGPFGAFAVRCARGQVIKALDRAGARKHQLLSRAMSLDSSPAWMTPRDAGGDMFRASLHDRLASPSRLDQPVARLLAREQLDEVLAGLPALTAKERAALTGVLNGKSHEQLAAEQGSTRKAVSLALRRARRKLAAEEALAPDITAGSFTSQPRLGRARRGAAGAESRASRGQPHACARGRIDQLVVSSVSPPLSGFRRSV